MGLIALADCAAQARLPKPLKSMAVLEDAAANVTPAVPRAPPSAVTTALQKLVEFIPTETIVLFWLAVPAAKSLATWLAKQHGEELGASPTSIDWWMFCGLIGLTPVLFLLTFLSKLASARERPPPLSKWPWWKTVAATIAFPVWAIAVPGNPFVADPGLLVVVWVGASLVSLLLGLLDPILDPLPPLS